jgi:acylphosphatase
MIDAFTGTIHGTVQGVGFRYFARNKAISLDLGGWVRNLPDGSVEIYANGPISDLERLLHYIETGPIGSQVEVTRIQWFQSEKEFKTFEIRG